MQIEINNVKYDVDIIKKNNRNTYVRVKNGRIVVTTNHFTSKNSIIKLIMDNKDSIIKMIVKDIRRRACVVRGDCGAKTRKENG